MPRFRGDGLHEIRWTGSPAASVIRRSYASGASPEATGCEILGKAEFLNPGGSVKDRAALWMVREHEKSGALRPGGTVVEGTAGNTGIGLAHVCNERGYPCVIYMPDNQSPEKVEILKTLGAEVRVVATVPYRDPMNYQKQAGRYAESLANAVWANQFDNVANRLAHVRIHRAGDLGADRGRD